jgi:hypothetical protein
MSKTRPTSMRMAAAVGSLALAASAFTATAVHAQDTPEDAINAFVVAFEAKDLEALPSFFCADQAETMGGIGLAGLLASIPPFVDSDLLLASLIVDVDLQSMTVTETSATEATVDVVGSMSTAVDVTALEPLAASVIELMGEEATPDRVQEMLDEMEGMIPDMETTDISGQVLLTKDDAGAWLICSPLPGASMAADVAGAAMASDRPYDDMSSDDPSDDMSGDDSSDAMASGDPSGDDA